MTSSEFSIGGFGHNNDEWSQIVAGTLVISLVGAVTERELVGLPTATISESFAAGNLTGVQSIANDRFFQANLIVGKVNSDICNTVMV